MIVECKNLVEHLTYASLLTVFLLCNIMLVVKTGKIKK